MTKQKPARTANQLLQLWLNNDHRGRFELLNDKLSMRELVILDHALDGDYSDARSPLPQSPV